MRTNFLLTLLILLLALACNSEQKNQKSVAEPSLIPIPHRLGIGEGTAVFNAETVITYDKGLQVEAEYLAAQILDTRGLALSVLALTDQLEPSKGEIRLSLSSEAEMVGSEGYTLSIRDESCTITAPTSDGVFYGIQTFLQSIPAGAKEFRITEMEITDQPAFQHRGLLLDCSRHFFSIDVVKKYIDLLARYKMNVLHWHLTEDQGWRIAIDAYPRLTEVGAWRTEADGSRYGGFYTKDEIREVVSYASARHITVIPEIEMPGHSLAALAAYPALACTKGPFEVTSEWGVFKDVYCAGDEGTFEFLETVLDEVLELFPSKYIHIGGDESPKYRWEHCSKCQLRMKEEGLEDTHELQSYFIRRIQTFLKSRGREIIGWDEIQEGGLAPGATVQSWRGMEGAIHAAQLGNKAILSPTSHCYLDYGLQNIDLEKIYSFDPIPEGLSEEEKEYIIGGECNIWTEHVPDEAKLDNQVLPRMIGLAEVLWSYNSERDYDEFRKRLQGHYPYLTEKGVNFGFEKVPVSFRTEPQGEELLLIRQDQLDGITCSYASTSGGDTAATAMDSVLVLRDDASFSIQVEQNGRLYPSEFNVAIAVHQALGIKPEASVPYSEYYTAGGMLGLCDGFKGTLDFRDGHWQGYAGTNVTFDLDFGQLRTVDELGAHFYQYNNAWIFPPQSMSVATSVDGKTYTDPIKVNYTGDLKDKEQSIHYLSVNAAEREARYVRFELESLGPLPAWHDAAGSDSWIFIDELIVK